MSTVMMQPHYSGRITHLVLVVLGVKIIRETMEDLLEATPARGRARGCDATWVWAPELPKRVSAFNAGGHWATHQVEGCFLDRVVNFSTHLQTEEHIDHDARQRTLDRIEISFHLNHDDPKDIKMLGLRMADNGKTQVFLSYTSQKILAQPTTQMLSAKVHF